MSPKAQIETTLRKRSMRYQLRSASSFPLRRHCERPSFLRPLQVFATQIVVRIQLPKLNLPTFFGKYDE